jgi:uncharacterized membrane protein YvbJ
MKRYLLCSGLIVLVTSILWAMGADTPEKAVREFKRAVDAENLADMARLMTEEDGSGPLKEKNLEKTKLSVEGLQRMWKGVEFGYDETVALENGNAKVNVTASTLSQEIYFVLKKFGESWYILDIEIYVR